MVIDLREEEKMSLFLNLQQSLRTQMKISNNKRKIGKKAILKKKNREKCIIIKLVYQYEGLRDTFFRVLARRTSYIGDKLHSLSLYISHSRETTTNSLNLTATRQNYNDTSLCIAILSPVSNGYLHVWCSRVLGTVQFLIEVLESKRTIMISRL